MKSADGKRHRLPLARSSRSPHEGRAGSRPPEALPARPRGPSPSRPGAAPLQTPHLAPLLLPKTTTFRAPEPVTRFAERTREPAKPQRGINPEPTAPRGRGAAAAQSSAVGERRAALGRRQQPIRSRGAGPLRRETAWSHRRPPQRPFRDADWLEATTALLRLAASPLLPCGGGERESGMASGMGLPVGGRSCS